MTDDGTFYQNGDTPENMLKANLSLEDQFPKQVQQDGLATVKALLRMRVEVGVVTSILGHLARKDLKHFGFPVEKFFILQGADNAPAHKPDPAVFDAALKLLKDKGIMPSEIVYVGDALMDYYAARRAGIGFIGITTGNITKEQFKTEGARVVLSLASLLKIIQKTNVSKL